MDRTSRVWAAARAALRRCLGALLLVAALGTACLAHAQERTPDEFAPGFRLKLSFHTNGIHVEGGRWRYVDLLASTADLDLDQLAGWRGASAHVELLHNYGARPRDLAGTLQRTNDEDVVTRRFRIYQAWVDQSFAGGRASLLAGVYDFKHEFAAVPASDALLNPSFSIAPELSRSGPGGAAVFPTSALAARLRVRSQALGYLQAAVVNADAGTVGDVGGLDTSFRKGLLLIGEVGIAGRTRLAAGAWRYTHAQPDIRDQLAPGAPAYRASGGIYALMEAPLRSTANGVRNLTVFARAGLSDGDTTPFAGSWQAGLRLDRVVAFRPDSVLSLGVTQGLISRKFRENRADAGRFTPPTETALELSYSDKLNPLLTLQPDLQWVHHPALNRFAKDAVVMSIRMKFEL